MAWPVTPNPDRFDEAFQFFGSRVVMTADFAVALDAKARTEAFWIGNGLQIHEVQSVFNEIQKAIDAGESFEDFRKRVSDKLGDKAHTETVFRNATQRSYNAGRWAQMREPDVLAARPYWMFDAILDSATTQICRDANGTVLPADHPWWDNNVPPRHHRCRSGIRNLRTRDAQRRGIASHGPTEAEFGFGAAPNESDIEALKPDPSRVDPRLVQLTRDKANDTRKPPPKPRKKAKAGPAKKPRKKPAKVARKNLATPQEHYDPAYWAERYREQYGEAAECVGWGRAMYERALDRPFGELAEQAQKLADAGHPLLLPGSLWERRIKQLAETIGTRTTLRGSALIAQAQEHYARVLTQIEHSLSIRAGKFPIEVVNDKSRQAKAFYETMLHESVARPSGYTQYIGTVVRPDGLLEKVDRAFHNAPSKVVALTERSATPVYVHEWAHAIEATDARALARSVSFHEARTKGEKERRLSQLMPSRGYGADETAKPDKYWSPYQGKTYPAPDGSGYHNTEMTAMGYQALNDPLDFGKQDAETTWFMLGQLAGR